PTSSTSSICCASKLTGSPRRLQGAGPHPSGDASLLLRADACADPGRDAAYGGGMPTTDLFTVAARAAVPPFHVMDLLAAAAQRDRTHGDLLNLVAGQPSTPAPVPVREAAKRALDQQVLGYTVAVGIPELREAICGHHERMHALQVDPSEV